MKTPWLSVALVALAGACAGGSASAPSAAAKPEGELCPAGLEGLAASTRNIDGGGSLVLTARANDVDELRSRMHRFGDITNARRRTDEQGEGFGDPRAYIHHSSLRVVDIPGGVRVDVRPYNEGRARELRRELADYAADFQAGRCPLALVVTG